MMRNWVNRLLGKMFMGVQKGMNSAMQEELKTMQEELMKGMLDPAKIMGFIKSMGIDTSQFGQMFGRMAQTGTMPQGFDPYRILGLDKSVTDEEVKQAYRKVMNRVHPDKAGPELTFLAAIANAAYELIKKERKWK